MERNLVSVIVCTLALIVLLVEGASITEPPTNTSALVGQNVTLKCKVQMAEGDLDSLTWAEYYSSSTGMATIIFKSLDPLKIHKPEKYEVFDTYNLLIKDVQLADAGLYSCGLYKESIQHAVDLIVLGQPSIEIPDTIHHGQPTEVRCVTPFGSRSLNDLPEDLRPVGNLLVEPAGVIVSNTSYDEQENTIIIESNSAVFQGQHKNVVCAVKSHFPPYTTTSVSKTLIIYYPVRDVSLSPTKKFYSVGDVITCKADGYPAPTFKWKNTRDGSTSQGSGLKVSELMVGLKNSWNCSATHTIDDVTYEAYKVIEFSATGTANAMNKINLPLIALAMSVYLLFKNII